MGRACSCVVRVALALSAAVLAGCGGSEAPDDAIEAVRPPEIARVMSAEEALAGAQVSKLHPATMNDAEIGNVLGPGPRCEFRYTSSGKPVLAVKTLPQAPVTNGVAKLNGSLVPLQPAANGTHAAPKGFTMLAGAVRTTITQLAAEQAGDRERRREASLVFEVDSRLRVGYRGYYSCAETPPSPKPK